MKTFVRTPGAVKLPCWLIGVIGAFFIICLVTVGLGVHYGELNSSKKHGTTTTAFPLTTRRPPTDWLLPEDVLPLSHDLKIQTYLPSAAVTFAPEQNFTFAGKLTILLLCNKPTDRIVMNSKGLTIFQEALKLTDDDGQQVEFDTPAFDFQPDLDKVTFMLKSQLRPTRRYRLSLNYTAPLSETLGGYYRSKYMENGTTRWLSSTHFECCQARMALPCFDAPNFKAQFNVTLVHPKDMIALSNQVPVSSSVSSDGWNTTVFAPTPKMSSYLLAFSINDFKHRDMFTQSNPPVMFRVWAPRLAYNQTQFSTTAGPVALDYYAQLFKQPFPLTKQDMLAVPDFAIGAMENWGLVTYRETALLYESTLSWQADKDRVAEVVAHELSHQWFGDLVTMKWWSDIWLNEGFATLFQYSGGGVILNETQRMAKTFPIYKVQSALYEDQLSTSHAIYDPYIYSPNEIQSVFDAISYDKGASLLRMLQHLLLGPQGQDVFILALQRYLDLHKYGNADHNDLWKAMNKVVGQQEQPCKDWNGNTINLTELMNPWIEQQGFPLVTVKRKGNTATLFQERFLLDQNLTAANNFTWHIPIWYIQATEKMPFDKKPVMVWIKKDVPTVLTLPSDETLIMNYDQLSFCRINYDITSWDQITTVLKTQSLAIPEINRAQILDDAMNLARKGTISYDVALDLTLYLVNESSSLPWKALAPSLTFIENMMANKAEYEYYEKYMSNLVAGMFNKLPTQDEFLKNFIFEKACQVELYDCLVKAMDEYNEFHRACKDDTQSSLCSKVPPYYRKSVYCSGVAQGSEDDFRFMWHLLGIESQAVEKVNLLSGICCTKEVHLVAKLLEESNNPNSIIRAQDVKILFNNLAMNHVAQQLIWNFFASNIQRTLQIHGDNYANMAAIIEAATKNANTEYQVKQMESFFNQHPDLQTGTSTFRRQLETARNNVEWMKKSYDNVVSWLKDNQNLPSRLSA